MFKEWGFLLTEIWVLLALAALLGLFAGWLIWGGRKSEVNLNAQLQDDLDACRARTAELEEDLATCLSDKNAAQADAKAAAAKAATAAAAAKPAAAKPAPKKAAAKKTEQTRPEALSGPRGGVADDLKLISGVGPKMEKLCNSLGFYHFDQIANWTKAEVSWVDENLEGFKGRVTRDKWVAQAKKLAKK